jgi:glycine/D-amino acid oxidase-like deaminating enzyme/nitrite reductase/ring-hydroxylating ferredoxin subunit
MNDVGERIGANISFWERTAEKFRTGPLTQDLSAEVCIVGAGIAGMTTAYLLTRAGRDVVVIDDGPVGGGMTGRTTAHLVNALDDRFYEIESMLGEEESRLSADSHTAAIDQIERIVQDEQIDCEFERIDGYLFLPPGGSTENLDEELDAIHRAGLSEVQRVEAVPHMRNTSGPSLRFPAQAQFHPLKYLNALAQAITARGAKIFTGTRVLDVAGGNPARITTRDRHVVNAQHAVVTTNTPVNDRFIIHSKQAPYATYVLAFRVERGAIPHALWWDTGQTKKDEEQQLGPAPYHYIRLARDGDAEVLIVGGEDHKTAQAFDFEARFKHLEDWTRERFPAVREITDRWSGQVMEPVDAMAYIGRNPADKENVYIATGDSGNGMTHGTIAGILLSDLIQGRSNPWEKLYDPSRKTLAPIVVADYVKENANVAAQMRDYVTGGDVSDPKDLRLGEGALIRDNVHKIAAYRDEEGTLHQFSAVCPHLKCIVRWNGTEKTWDCPCHGSRFDRLGRMVNGPSTGDLEPINGDGATA